MNSRQRPYGKVFLTYLHEWRAMPFLDYFKDSTKDLWLYSYSMFFNGRHLPAVFRLEHVQEGVTRVAFRWSVPGFFPKTVKYAVMYAGFALAALFVIPRGSWVISVHPYFGIGQSFWRMFKRFRFVYWVWDHCEDIFPTFSKLDDYTARHADRLLYVSHPMFAAYDRRAPAARPGQPRELLPHGIRKHEAPREPEEALIGFVGNLRTEDGLAPTIAALVKLPSVRLEIIGKGINEAMLRRLAEEAGVAHRVSWLGRIEDPSVLDQVTARWRLGVAAYDEMVITRYVDSAKAKLYAQQGLPAIVTEVMPAAKAVREYGIGEVIKTNDSEEIATAVRLILSRPEHYASGLKKFCEAYEYRSLFDRGFEFMRD